MITARIGCAEPPGSRSSSRSLPIFSGAVEGVSKLVSGANYRRRVRGSRVEPDHSKSARELRSRHPAPAHISVLSSSRRLNFQYYFECGRTATRFCLLENQASRMKHRCHSASLLDSCHGRCASQSPWIAQPRSSGLPAQLSAPTAWGSGSGRKNLAKAGNSLGA